MAGDNGDGDGNRYEGRARNVVQSHNVGVMNVYTGPGGERASEPPWSLPPGANPFLNRESPLREATVAVGKSQGRGNPALVIVAGLRGVGKTAMAVQWATSERERFPDGLLYADLGGALSRRGLGGGLGETATDLLEQLGIAGEHQPHSDQGRLALLRSQLARRKAFLLLDNVRVARDVDAFVPPSPGCVVFVTTDGELTEVGDLAGRHDAEVIPLRGLPEEDGLSLLRMLLEPERVNGDLDGARALLRLCGGWPLAIRMAAGRLKTRRNLSLADLAARMEADHRDARPAEGEGAVRVLGDEVYEAMPAEVQRAYRLLSLHPGGGDRPTAVPRGARGPAVVFGPEAAAALLDRRDADVLLEALVDRHLLDEDGDRYIFHDLIRAHARAKAERDEDADSRDAAVRRAIEWYLRFAAEADLAVNSHRPTTGPVYRDLRGRPSPYGTGREAVGRALAALRSEHRNLCAAVHAAGERGWHDLAWQLCEALWGFFFSLKHYD